MNFLGKIRFTVCIIIKHRKTYLTMSSNWRRLLRVPWTARRSSQSILKETSPGCSLEGLMLKLQLQYFGHVMQRADSLEQTLMLGRIEGRRRKGQQRVSQLDSITYSVDMGFCGHQQFMQNFIFHFSRILLDFYRTYI